VIATPGVVVAHGNGQKGVRACGLCHNPNGKGRSENAGVAGLPVGYFVQTMADLKSGARKSTDPRWIAGTTSSLVSHALRA